MENLRVFVCIRDPITCFKSKIIIFGILYYIKVITYDITLVTCPMFYYKHISVERHETDLLHITDCVMVLRLFYVIIKPL